MEAAESAETPAFRVPDAAIRDILEKYKTVAVVGLSTKPEKPGNFVPKYLKEKGYRIIPVNPAAKGELLGEKVYPSLSAIPVQVDIVDVFRPAKDLPPIMDEAIEIGAKVVWMQEGIVNNAAAEKGKKAGITVVMDRCMMKMHRSL